MKDLTIGLPAGFRDVLFDGARKRRHLDDRLATFFVERGFQEVRPSTVEFFELYQRGNQSIADRALRFLDRDDNLVALRGDFTPAVARIAASKLLQHPLPLKVWYSGSVFRKVTPHQGLLCEMDQIGTEIIGINSLEQDCEVIDVAMAALAMLGVEDVQVHLNHAGIFRGLLSDLRLGRKELKSVKSAIDRKDTRALAERLKTLGIRKEAQEQINAISTLIGGEEVLARARSILTNDEELAALDHLDALRRILQRWSGRLAFDFTEIDEMEYYTGIMCTFFSPQLRGELGRGGRYDNLLKDFGKDMPAIGFSFSVESLLELL
jgi:ATP phosphoribosyltransferase regulatory subunit